MRLSLSRFAGLAVLICLPVTACSHDATASIGSAKAQTAPPVPMTAALAATVASPPTSPITASGAAAAAAATASAPPPSPAPAASDGAAAASEPVEEAHPLAPGAAPATWEPATLDAPDAEARLRAEVHRWRGVRYADAGTTRSGIGNPEFVRAVFQAAFGTKLPARYDDQIQTGKLVDRQALAPGDLVFFEDRDSARSNRRPLGSSSDAMRSRSRARATGSS